MTHRALALALLTITACSNRGGGGGDDDDDSGGSGACGRFCSALQGGENCQDVDGDTCRTECGQFSEQQGVSRLSCADSASALAQCLGSLDMVCEAPGQAAALADGTPAAEPAYVWVPSGSIRVEDFACAELAHERDDCINEGPFVDFTEEQVFEAESPEMFHGSGEQTDDGWQCADCWDHIVYGPYVRTTPGRYRATYRVAATCRADAGYEDLVFSVNVAVGGTTIAETYVTCADLSGSGFEEYALDFDYTSGSLEVRVYDNYAATLAVDSIRVVQE